MDSEGDATAAGPSGGLDTAWKNFGRDNPAGKALFKLYNKDAAKQVGNSYHTRNKQVYDRKLASGWTPAPVTEPPKPTVEKPQVEVPKFPKRIQYDTARVNFIPRRRPLEVIRRDIDAEYERMRTAPQAPPNRPVLDEKEKARLAELMRFRGKVPTVTPEQLAAQLKAGPGRKSEREQLEEMFEAIVREIDERREFLQALEAAGRLRQDTVNMIRGEIQGRVAELQRVDTLLQQYAAEKK
ncbi:hypothetical protein PLESTB_000672200 [Pleodorina starrii]|uniref:Uncharacterized protein n=1 Tax=Pleodorina starrii TaxID=330485 RepID=A0A9W6BJZ5_9CHLO|nr:hypothetical protein PLESTB_000672200 [Pleodorina starrii]GLC65835.1 hypothetical protein PLESTF_000348400 [Pleodorina starrii]